MKKDKVAVLLTALTVLALITFLLFEKHLHLLNQYTKPCGAREIVRNDGGMILTGSYCNN